MRKYKIQIIKSENKWQNIAKPEGYLFINNKKNTIYLFYL